MLGPVSPLLFFAPGHTHTSIVYGVKPTGECNLGTILSLFLRTLGTSLASPIATLSYNIRPCGHQALDAAGAMPNFPSQVYSDSYLNLLCMHQQPLCGRVFLIGRAHKGHITFIGILRDHWLPVHSAVQTCIPGYMPFIHYVVATRLHMGIAFASTLEVLLGWLHFYLVVHLPLVYPSRPAFLCTGQRYSLSYVILLVNTHASDVFLRFTSPNSYINHRN